MPRTVRSQICGLLHVGPFTNSSGSTQAYKQADLAEFFSDAKKNTQSSNQNWQWSFPLLFWAEIRLVCLNKWDTTLSFLLFCGGSYWQTSLNLNFKQHCEIMGNMCIAHFLGWRRAYLTRNEVSFIPICNIHEFFHIDQQTTIFTKQKRGFTWHYRNSYSTIIHNNIYLKNTNK